MKTPMNNEYRFTFQARLRGALCHGESRVETVKAESAKDALMKLYERYEHIYFPVAVNVATGVREECR